MYLRMGKEQEEEMGRRENDRMGRNQKKQFFSEKSGDVFGYHLGEGDGYFSMLTVSKNSGKKLELRGKEGTDGKGTPLFISFFFPGLLVESYPEPLLTSIYKVFSNF